MIGRRRLPASFGLGIGLSAFHALFACGPDEHSGLTHHVYLPEAGPEPTGGQPNVAADAEVEAGPPPAPRVDLMTPTSGAYGTEIRIAGAGLGSGTRAGVRLVLGEQAEWELRPDKKPEVLSWNESEIRFRFPFPLEGKIVVETPEGTALAGEFTPSWQPGPSFGLAGAVKALASISSGARQLAFVQDAVPLKLIAFDGNQWTESTIQTSNPKTDALRLYLDSSGTLRGFVLSDTTPPKLVTLDPQLVATETAFVVSGEYAVDGGPDGASLWFRESDGWHRARPGPDGGDWEIDKGPMPDPNPTGSHHTAGSTSDGTLYIGYAKSTGNTFDDLGAPFLRRLPPEATMFEAEARAGNNVDDYVSSLRLEGRANGLIVHYCGSDVDPFGVSSTDLICYVGLFPSAGTPVMRSVKVTDAVKYAFAKSAVGVTYCSQTHGIRLISALTSTPNSLAQLDAIQGQTAVWPCGPIVAAEIDTNGELLLILQHDSKLYFPRPRTTP